MNPNLTKSHFIRALIAHFKESHQLLLQSAKAAHSAATHEESKAEDRHDTFAIEASYLAAGQAKRVASLAQTILEFEQYLNHLQSHSTLQCGSLFQYQSDGQKHIAFMAKLGGGTKIKVDSDLIHVISIHSPLGEALENAVLNDEIELEIKGALKSYQILRID